jgi:protein-disulfide isomerase
VTGIKGDRAPCGCVFGSVDDVFVVEPCSPTCDLYAYVVEQARKKGMPIGEQDLRTTGKFETFDPRCPYCDAKLNGFTGAKDERPSSGAVSLCCYCGEASIFGDDNLRKPTKREARQMQNDPKLQAMVKIVRGSLREYPFDDRKPQ